METKVKSKKAQTTNWNITFYYIEVYLMDCLEEYGYYGWLLWRYSSRFCLEIMSTSNKFIHCYIQDNL